MFSQIFAFSALLAVTLAGPVPEVHFSPAEAVSSQSIIRHDQPAIATNLVHTPVTKLVSPVFHTAPTAVTYATASPITYQAAPIHYSPHVLSTHNIVRHEQLPTIATKLIAATPVTKFAVATPFQYPTYTPTITKVIQPVTKVIQPVKVFQPITKVIQPVTKLIQPNKLLVSENHAEQFTHPKYEFSYSVDDDQSGDHKSQHEIRDGDVVHGEYTMLEADGTIRKVQYTADDIHGFNAVVSHSAHHPNPHPHPHPHHEPIILN